MNRIKVDVNLNREKSALPGIKPFEFLEHIADAYIAAYGATLEEAFSNAALAMFEVMTDTKTVKVEIEETVKVQAEDEFALLYSWLENLLVNFEICNNLYSKFDVKEIGKTDKGYFLEATVGGEAYNPAKHPSRTGVKAITYHEMKIVKRKDAVTIKFLLDI